MPSPSPSSSNNDMTTVMQDKRVMSPLPTILPLHNTNATTPLLPSLSLSFSSRWQQWPTMPHYHYHHHLSHPDDKWQHTFLSCPNDSNQWCLPHMLSPDNNNRHTFTPHPHPLPYPDNDDNTSLSLPPTFSSSVVFSIFATDQHQWSCTNVWATLANFL